LAGESVTTHISKVGSLFSIPIRFSDRLLFWTKGFGTVPDTFSSLLFYLFLSTVLKNQIGHTQQSVIPPLLTFIIFENHMWHKQLFTAQANHCWTEIRSIMPLWYRTLGQDGEIDYGWSMYENAAAASLNMLILGDITLRTNGHLLANVGVTAVETTRETARLVQSNSRNLINTGGVLNERYWWPFFNDCWVLGGVHGKHEFHLASDDWPADDDLWDSGKRRPTMLGRELLILSISGYTLRRAGQMGMVFFNTNHMKAFCLGFTNIYSLDPGNDKDAFLLRIKEGFSFGDGASLWGIV
jgi:hypothetical protein